MAELLAEIRTTARSRDPSFLTVQQNAPRLLDDAPASIDAIDGLAIEDLTFGGAADTAWGDPESGDVRPDPVDRSETQAFRPLSRRR